MIQYPQTKPIALLTPTPVLPNNLSLLTKNIASLHIIQAHNTTLNSSLIPIPKMPLLSIQTSKEGIPYGTYNKCDIHSKYAPSKESLQVKNYLENKVFDCIIIFGMGLGYIPETIYTHYPTTHIIIIELHIPLITELLSSIDYSQNTALKNIVIFINPSIQMLIDYLDIHNIKNTLCIHTQTAKVCFDIAHIQMIKKEIHSYENKIRINLRSLKKYQYRWPKNILENISTPIPLYTIDSLKDIHKHTPALLCAAGPSLESYIDVLDILYKKMLVVCVDTALPILHQKNVVPDYIVVADPQFINTMHLQYSLTWALSKGTQLIIDLSTSSRVLHLIEQSAIPNVKIYTSIPQMPFAQTLCDSINMHPIQSGGSVATFAIDICNTMGIHTLYTLGFDLSYPNKKSHCKDTYFEKKSALESNRLQPIEGQTINRFMSTHTHMLIETYEHKSIYTDIQLNTYRNWIEDYLENNTHLVIRTLSPNTGKIQGIAYRNFDTIQALKNIRPPNTKQISKQNTNQISKQKIQHSIHRIMTQLLCINTEIEKTSLLLQQKTTSIDEICCTINRILSMQCMDIIQGLYKSEMPKQIQKNAIPNNHYAFFQDIIDSIKNSLQTFIRILQPYTD